MFLREVAMKYTLVLWHADHVNFGRLLNLVERELAPLHDAGAPDYALMLDIMYYMTHHSDIVHHPKEDLVFARIKAHDERAGPAVDALTAQHVQLREMGAALANTLDDVVNGSIASREHVEATARAYVSALRAHMRTEEGEILPRAARLLSESDWTDINTTIAKARDPLFGAQLEERYARLREEINRQAQAVHVPPH
jgi:hemerythrin-like domain-containing protein